MANLPVPGELGPVDYSTVSTPPQYHCGKCGAHGVKLWRDYQTFLDYQSLLCAGCACAEQSTDGKSYSVTLYAHEISVTTVYDAALQPQLHKAHGGKNVGGDQIGWRIPAVPTSDGSSYWGYSSVPSDGVQWWMRLPLTERK